MPFCMQTNQLRAHPANRLFLELLYAWSPSPCLNYGSRHLTTSLFPLEPTEIIQSTNPKSTCPSTAGSYVHTPTPSASPVPAPGPSVAKPSEPCMVWQGPSPLGAMRSKPSCQGQCLLTCWPHLSLNNNKTCILKHFYRNYLSPQGKYVQTSLEREGYVLYDVKIWILCYIQTETV